MTTDTPTTHTEAARNILLKVAEHSALIRWRSLQGLKIDIKTSDEVDEFNGDQGARLRIDRVDNLDGTEGICDLTIFRREQVGHEAIWYVIFGNVDKECVPEVYTANPALPTALGVRNFVDSDSCSALNTWCDAEWEAFKVLRAVDVALHSMKYPRFDDDDAAALQWGATSEQMLADWIEDLGNRCGCDTREIESRVEAFVRAARLYDSQVDAGCEWLLADDA